MLGCRGARGEGRHKGEACHARAADSKRGVSFGPGESAFWTVTSYVIETIGLTEEGTDGFAFNMLPYDEAVESARKGVLEPAIEEEVTRRRDQKTARLTELQRKLGGFAQSVPDLMEQLDDVADAVSTIEGWIN